MASSGDLKLFSLLERRPDDLLEHQGASGTGWPVKSRAPTAPQVRLAPQVRQGQRVTLVQRVQTGAPGATGATGPAGPAGPSAPGVVATHVTGRDSSHCSLDFWANDDYTRTLQFIPQDNGKIQVVRTYNGTFTTIAGSSQPNPAGSGGSCPSTPQMGGVTGTITGFDTLIVTGGVFTPNATCPDPCTTSRDARDVLPGWRWHCSGDRVGHRRVGKSLRRGCCWPLGQPLACAWRGHRQHHRRLVGRQLGAGSTRPRLRRKGVGQARPITRPNTTTSPGVAARLPGRFHAKGVMPPPPSPSRIAVLRAIRPPREHHGTTSITPAVETHRAGETPVDRRRRRTGAGCPRRGGHGRNKRNAGRNRARP